MLFQRTILFHFCIGHYLCIGIGKSVYPCPIYWEESICSFIIILLLWVSWGCPLSSWSSLMFLVCWVKLYSIMSNAFSASIEMIWFSPLLVDMENYIDRFLYVKLFLHSWDNLLGHSVTFFYIFLDLSCYNFMKDFWVYVHER